MKNVYKELKEEIKKLEVIEEDVVYHNAGETLQSIGDSVNDFLILHRAKLQCILNDIKILKHQSESRTIIDNEQSKKVCPHCNGSGELAGGLVGCHHCGNY